jgi:RND family efflux transporter MFP subunit
MNKFLCLMVLLLCIAGCKKNRQAAPPPPPIVEVASVTQSNVPVYHEWVGVIEGLVNARIRAQVVGYLISQNYREGDPIKKGDVLFEIDQRPFQAVLDQAKGVLAQAEAKLGKTELDVKRYFPLLKDSAISREEYEDAVQADLEAKAAVVSARAAVEQAQVNLGFTRIQSPIDGIASFATGQIGDLVGPNTGDLTTVSTVDPIKVYFNVTEQAYINFTKRFTSESNRYERLRELEIKLILADGSFYPLNGRIYAVDRQVSPTTGALRVAALFSNPNYTLRPGQFTRVRIKFELANNALMVPQKAVSELQGAFQVAILTSNNTVHIQPVHLGERVGTLWVVKDGVQLGDRVVVEGTQKVREGSTVTVTNAPAQPKTSTH